MNFSSQIFFNNINHGHRAVYQRKLFVTTSVLYGCGYLLLLCKGAQNNAHCNISNRQGYLAHFSAQAQKIRKSSYIFLYLINGDPPKKILIFQETKTLENFLYFGKWSFLALAQKIKKTSAPRKFPTPILKNFSHFLKGKLFLYFRKQNPQKNFLYFLNRRLFLYFRKQKPRNNSIYLRKYNFLIFQETETLKSFLELFSPNLKKVHIFQKGTSKA